MPYQYHKERPWVLTPEGQKILLHVHENVINELSKYRRTSVKSTEAWTGITCDTWRLLACLDYLCELNVLRETSYPDAWGQHRTFVRGCNG